MTTFTHITLWFITVTQTIRLTVVLGAEVVMGLEVNSPPSSSDSVLSENRPPDLLGGA